MDHLKGGLPADRICSLEAYLSDYETPLGQACELREEQNSGSAPISIAWSS